MASAPSQQHMEGIRSTPLTQGLILAQWRIQEEAIVTECSRAESRLHSTSCAYDHLSISKADYCFAPRHLPVLAAHAWHPRAVIPAHRRRALSLSTALGSSRRGGSALCPCWRCRHAGLQRENCSFGDVQQTGHLPSLPMKH